MVLLIFFISLYQNNWFYKQKLQKYLLGKIKHTLGGRYIEVQWLSKYGSIFMSTS